ncbi:MAG: AAA domain-containing protein [bacterium]|nr:AAA domain-containing protein [bacterium]
MTITLQESAQSVCHAVETATHGLVDRDKLAELIVLSAVAQEHLLVIGPPGTGKSQVVRRVAQTLGGGYFEYLLGRFTEPNEIFGPIDLQKLREGMVETETRNMLPEADIAFLDEVFLGSTAILNTLLNILNERMFSRGHTRKKCPLRVCVSASNAIPGEESLAAFADRFLVHVFVNPLEDALLESLLEGGWKADHSPLSAVSSMAHLDRLSQYKNKVELSGVRSLLAHGFRLLRKAGIILSDRRLVKCQSLVAAASVLAGRDKAGEADIWPIIFAIPTKEGQALGKEVLHDLLEKTGNPSLPSAAEDASLGPLARAQRLCSQGEELLEEKPGNKSEMPHWFLKLEALAREIDAGIPASARSERITKLYGNVKELLENNNDAITDVDI